MCFLLSLIFLGPRAGIIFWWIVEPGRWDRAFSSFIIPALGFIFLPWTTLMFVAVAPYGNVAGWDWAWLGFALLGDFVALGGGGYTNRSHMPGYA